MVKQVIQIVTEFVDKASAPIKKLVNSTKQLSYEQQTLQNASKYFGTSAKYLQKELKDLNLVFTKERELYDVINDKVVSLRKGLYKAAQRAKRFKFEWLTIMFAGMALDRVFGSIIRKQFELYGVTEMTGAAWTEVMAPVMDLLTPALYKLLEVFMDLPEPLKFVIGTVVIFGAILGKVAGTIGAFMLPYTLLASRGITIASVFGTLGSKLAALGKLFPAVGSTALHGIGAIIAIIGGLILIVKGVYNVIKAKVEGIGQIIMGVGAILFLFIGWWAAIPTVVGFVVWAILKYCGKARDFVISVFNYIKRAFSAVKDFIVAGFKKIKEALLNLFPNWMLSLLKGGFKIIGGFGRKILGGVLGGFQHGGVVPKTGPYILHRGETVIPAGATYAPSITVYATVSSEYDVRKLASQLNRYWVEDFERLTKSRGIM